MLRGAVSLADSAPDPLRLAPTQRAEIQANSELWLELAEALAALERGQRTARIIER